MFLQNKIFDGEPHKNQLEILTICSYLAAYTPPEVERAMKKVGFRTVAVDRRENLITGIGVK